MDIAVERHVNYPFLVVCAIAILILVLWSLLLIMGNWNAPKRVERFKSVALKVLTIGMNMAVMMGMLSFIGTILICFMPDEGTNWNSPHNSQFSSKFAIPSIYVNPEHPHRTLDDVLHDEYGLSKDGSFYKDKDGVRLDCYADTSLNESKTSVHLTVHCQDREYHEVKPTR